MGDWSLACPDWEQRLRDGRSLVPDLPLNLAEAERAVAVFDRLRLADVPGHPTLREAAGDWFRDIVRAVFGAWFPEQGERHIREVFALVGKKNSKTSYSGGLMLTALLLNKRPRGKLILVAPTQDVAEIAFSQIDGMIRLEPKLRDELTRIQVHLKRITMLTTGATLEVMSFDPEVLTGQKPTAWLLDELHLMSKSAKASSALGQIRGGMIAQPEAFGVMITTQSERAPAGVFRAELNKARAIRDGKASGRTLPILYEFPTQIARDRDAWSDPRHWPMVVPNNGRSIKIERLIEEFRTAEQDGEDEVKRWASQHLNVEIGVGLGSTTWIGANFWDQAAEPALSLEELIERSEVAVIGIDGGGMDDLFGLAVLGRERKTRRYLLWTHAWAHEIVLERRKSIAQLLRDFERDGDLTIIADREDEIPEAVEIAVRLEAAGLLPDEEAVGLDPVGVGAVVNELAAAGIGEGRVSGVRQGFQLQGAIKSVERQLARGAFLHGGSAMMSWCVGNARTEIKGNAALITKAASGVGKIDPLMACFDAVALMDRGPTAGSGGPSVYEERDLIVL